MRLAWPCIPSKREKTTLQNYVPMNKPVMFLLVRHGETNGNVVGRIQDPDTKLSSRGLKQAKMLAQWCKNNTEFDPVAIMASDYSRARTTAETIQKATGLPLVFNELLRERNFGDLRGCAYADLIEAGINPLDEDLQPPNGESWDTFRKRVDLAFESIVSVTADLCAKSPPNSTMNNSHPKVVIVVSHGLVIGDMLTRRIHCPDTEDEMLFRMRNTSVTTVLEDKSVVEGFRALSVGRVDHLRPESDL